MSDARVEAWRNALAKLGAVCCLLLVVSLMDAVIAKFRESPQEHHVLPGEVVQLTGPVGENDQAIGDLVITGDSAAIQVRVDAIRPGFWLGGAMWHARVTVSPNAAAGDHVVRIHARQIPADKVQALHIMVHADAADYQQSSKSVIRRVLNFSPWWMTIVWAACAAINFLCVFVLSNRIDQSLAQEGRAEIYLIRPTDGGQEIVFGLGSRYGVEAGTQFDVLDKSGLWIGFAEVRKVTEDDALAWVKGDRPVEPESMVVKR
jgi:hypothetical protein